LKVSISDAMLAQLSAPMSWPGEERVLATEHHRPFILPALRMKWRFIIGGTRFATNGFPCIAARFEPALG
jgi:hypothetical protein